MPADAIVLEAVAKGYGRTPALAGLSLVISQVGAKAALIRGAGRLRPITIPTGVRPRAVHGKP